MKILIAALLLFPMVAWAQTFPSEPSGQASAPFGSSCAYPDSALRAHAVGKTGLTFRIADDGSIADIKIVSPSGDVDLDAAAAECVAHWRTDPSSKMPPGWRSGTVAWTIPLATQDGKPSVPAGQFQASGGGAKCNIEAKAEGTTIVLVHVTEEGAVSGVDVIQSSGNADLDEASRACVMQNWRFRPAMQNGKPVAASKKYAIRWSFH